MATDRSGRGRRRNGRAGSTLEDLVATVAALDGARAELLLSGLDEPLRLQGLELLTQLRRASRAEQHAQLADAFGCAPALPRAVEGIPGRLGVAVRSRAVRGPPAPGQAGEGLLARWARRLLLELGAP